MTRLVQPVTISEGSHDRVLLQADRTACPGCTCGAAWRAPVAVAWPAAAVPAGSDGLALSVSSAALTRAVLLVFGLPLLILLVVGTGVGLYWPSVGALSLLSVPAGMLLVGLLVRYRPLLRDLYFQLEPTESLDKRQLNPTPRAGSELA